METRKNTANKSRILVIDDNSAIQEDFTKILNPDSEKSNELNNIMQNMFEDGPQELALPVFEVHTASQGQEGLKMVKAALAAKLPYAVAFVDIRMPPGWDGIETIKQIWKIDPKIQMIICTAYSDYSWSETIAELGQSDNLLILKKPFDNVEIRQLACALSEKWHLNQQLEYQLKNLKALVDARTATLQAALEESKAMEQQLAYQATHDLLTKLPNRALLIDRIDQTIKHAKRKNTLFAILFFDLDRFKLINDTLGHKAGDTLLQTIAQRLKNNIRDTDTVARLGGDEFVILLDDLQNEESCILSIKKLLTAVTKPVTLDKHKHTVTASIGISLYPQGGQDAEKLLKNADTAMYRAKEVGRNNFQFFTEEMNQRATKRLELELHLLKAVERNEFLLRYQPSIDLNNGNIVNFEALLRWQHPQLGLVPPMQFIPLAEETGAILPIGEWVINTACQQLKAWKDKGLNSQVAINLSGSQLKQKNIVEIIQSAIINNHIDSEKLELELTESSIISDTEFSLQTLKKLKDLGVKIAIDDFGTGYSSLSYLSRFPIDKIKIDQSFVRCIGQGTKDIAIIIAILTLGNKLNLRIVAEGVETIEQLLFLKENHCQEIQGFYFSKPLKGQDCTELLLNKTNLFNLIDPSNIKRS